MKEEYGAVKKKGVEYILTQQAYADNYGADGEVIYKAMAEDEEGNEYRVIWETTTEFDEAQELHSLENDEDLTDEEIERKEELIENGVKSCYCEDESNACDWDNPVSISRV